jgi:phosphoglycolate phosphatase-like HAD superfamily hydrolase
MIGDSIYDMRCARGAGVACIAAAYGAALRESLLEENPDMIVDTPDELLKWAESAFLQMPCPERN